MSDHQGAVGAGAVVVEIPALRVGGIEDQARTVRADLTIDVELSVGIPEEHPATRRHPGLPTDVTQAEGFAGGAVQAHIGRNTPLSVKQDEASGLAHVDRPRPRRGEPRRAGHGERGQGPDGIQGREGQARSTSDARQGALHTSTPSRAVTNGNTH
ncbi:hypothetical protein GCM10028781_00680 [Nostocoides australiense]